MVWLDAPADTMTDPNSVEEAFKPITEPVFESVTSVNSYPI